MTERSLSSLVQHTCEILGRPIFVPLSAENYNSRVIIAAKCLVCGKTELEKIVDKTFAPTKGSYITV